MLLLRTKIIQKLVYINEKLIFYPKLTRFYAAKFKDKPITIIDVGSNKGQSIDFFKKISKIAVIFGFEPNKKLYERLVKKHEGNLSISISNKGISSTEGSLTFHENIMDETSTFEELNYNSQYLEKKARILGVAKEDIITDRYSVEVTTLDKFLSEHVGLFFDVLKIDIEGHELQGLKGLFTGARTKFPIRFIQIESHNDDMYQSNSRQGEINDLLLQNGFEAATKIKHGFGDFYEIIFENKNL
jgi:FkbM family methyltransferase